jgi:hypothetical protein
MEKATPRGIKSWHRKGRAASTAPISGLVSGIWVAFERFSVDHGRTSPVGLPSFIALDAHAGSAGGLGLSPSIRLKSR